MPEDRSLWIRMTDSSVDPLPSGSISILFRLRFEEVSVPESTRIVNIVDL
jgi:hypothetical protein